jgi:hypothetical protein
MRMFLRAAIVGAALLLGCGAEDTDSIVATVYKSPT